MLCELTLAAPKHMLCAIACATFAPDSARPSILSSAAPNAPVHYFGFGSNMCRDKVENRAAGSKLELLDFQPAVVRGHRLAFNMRGFAPLEPGIAGLEPCQTSECHGALITLTAKEYERLMASEGGTPGDYEEVIVPAVPYAGGEPVHAIALRAREHARLDADACPSERYMRLLIRGARELGLKPSYIAALEKQCTQAVPTGLRQVAIHHLFLVSALFRLHLRSIVRAQSWLLWRAYVPSTERRRLRRLLGNGATAILLAPGAILGALIRLFMWVSCIPPPPMLAKYANEGFEPRASCCR